VDDAGIILSAKLGISVNEFAERVEAIKKKNITQLGGELAYLVINDPLIKARYQRICYTRPAGRQGLKKMCRT